MAEVPQETSGMTQMTSLANQGACCKYRKTAVPTCTPALAADKSGLDPADDRLYTACVLYSAWHCKAVLRLLTIHRGYKNKRFLAITTGSILECANPASRAFSSK